MLTTRSSSRPEGDLHQASPPGAGTPRSRPPLPGPDTPPGPGIPRGQTHACKRITLPQTSFAGGNKKAFQ